MKLLASSANSFYDRAGLANALASLYVLKTLFARPLLEYQYRSGGFKLRSLLQRVLVVCPTISGCGRRWCGLSLVLVGFEQDKRTRERGTWI